MSFSWAAYESLKNDPEPGTSIHTPEKEAVVCAYCGKDIEGDEKFCNEACAILENIDLRGTLEAMIQTVRRTGHPLLANSYQRVLNDFQEGFVVAKQIITDSFHE